MKEILTSSENINHEYCATVVRIGEVKPIEGSDFLGQTLVNGLSIVVRKDLVKEGDIMFYAANETALNLDFLSVTNQFDMSHRDLNKNYKEIERRLNLIQQLRDEDKFEEAADLEMETKQMVGFFNQHGRVKMIRLRGCPSMGYLISVDSMADYCPEIKDVNLEELVDTDFDTVNDVLFIKVYIPPKRTQSQHAPGEGRRAKRRMKQIKKFDRIIPGEFAFHYDTQQLNRSMYRINPDDVVTISNKKHGTSWIMGRIKVKKPFNPNPVQKWHNNVINRKVRRTKDRSVIQKKIRLYGIGYDNVYSSRTVIKNQFINAGVTAGFYGTDVWGEYNDIMKPFIPEGMTVYGEIFGYLTGSQSMIQKDYDYGCAEGTNKLMPYRISTKNEDGTSREWEVIEVYNWTVNLMKEHPEIADRLSPIEIFYHGSLLDFYPSIDIASHWHETVLEALKIEPRFGMEQNEPQCVHKVPREGIVLRIDNDPMKEAFKLKCIKFLKKESEEIDNGTYEDIEVSERYQEDEL